MKLAIVFNPFSYKVHEENLRIVQKYFGLFPPLSLTWVASIARSAGHDVIIIDARTLRLTQKQVLEILKNYRPDILGFMMTTYQFPETLEWLKFLKSNLHPTPYTLIGGYNLRVYPKESVSHPGIDFGCVEQAYYTVPELLKQLEGQKKFEEVPGLVYKKNGEIFITSHPQKIDFDKFPNPARDLLPNDLYAEFPTERKNFTVMVTSLGCPHQCSFCEAGGTPYSPRSPETVIKEIEECYYKYAIREIDFFDYQFTGIRKRVLDICDKIIEKKLDITWACRSRTDTVDDEMLKKMSEAGCSRIYYGIESGDQIILDNVNKGITLDRIRETIKLTKKYKIRPLGFFLVGSPGETKETFKKTLGFAKELDLDYVQFSKCLAKPLTPLWKEMVEKTGKDYWADWILGKETDRALPRPWTTLTNEEIDKLAKSAYIKYHSRLKFLIRHTLKVKSLLEFFRKFFAYLEMVFTQEKKSRKDKKFKAYPERPAFLFKFRSRKTSKWSLPF